MEPNSNQPSGSDSTSVPEHVDPTGQYAQMPPRPDVDQLTSMKVDLNDAPQPGSSFSPAGSESNGNATAPTYSYQPEPTAPAEPAPAPTVQGFIPNVIQPQTEQIPPHEPVQQPAVQPVQPAAPAGPSVFGGGAVVSDHSQPPAPGGMVNSSMPPSPNSNQPAKKRRISIKVPKKAALISMLAVFILAGGMAAAYVGVILPNNPNNVLKQAMLNSIEASNDTVDGTIQTSETGGAAFKVGLVGEANKTAKTADLSVNLTVSGVTFPVEVRLVDSNIYFKFGDLSEIASLISAVSPSYSSVLQSVSSELSNKWISVDSTIVNESGLSCFINSNWNFSNSDISILENLYGSYPFMHINSTSSATISGQNAEQFNVTVNDNKAASFAKGLNKLSMVTQLEKCAKTAGGSGSQPNFSSLADNSNTPINIYVNKSTKQIVQITANSTSNDASKGVHGNLTFNFNYSPVNISAPEGAEPAVQVFANIATQLQKSGISTGTSGSGSSLDQLFNSFNQ